MKDILIWSFLLSSCAFVLCKVDGPYSYKVLYLETPLDHFSFTQNVTFQLRYLLNDTFWKPGGPIFFYTGNEGDIELFAQNTGFMWEIAPKFNALLVFAEHRYYGKTLPYADKSYSDYKHLGYLTSTQALADYVYLLKHIQEGKKIKSYSGKRSPVIAFGGSYGGMLAAWIRLKYPYVVDGSVASSAPIYQFSGLTRCDTFSDIVGKVFNVSSAKGECAKNIKKSWGVIRNITSTNEGKEWLTKEWKLCKPLNTTEDITDLTDNLSNIYGNIAMINYPYPTNFLAKVPANPVRALCEKIDQSGLDGKPLLTALRNAISIYTNYTGTSKCLIFNDTSALGDQGWNFQACTEVVMPMCTGENNELFEKTTWDMKKYSDDCYKQFGTRVTRDDIAILEYGGKEAAYSNVIFTNGLLDPWSPGGCLESKSQSVYTILMPEAAHHLDLRASNPNDPESVINARMHIKTIIDMWLKIFKMNY